MSLRAVIWCAVSSNPQAADDKESLPTQEAQARDLCTRNGWTIVEVLVVSGHSRRYIDIHEVAHAMSRQGITAFTRLIELWETRGFDVLIVRDGDRFARTQTLHAYVTEKTISIGARIYSLNDGWIDERNYRMWAAMSGYKAASSIDSLVQAHRIAMDSAARRGLPTNWSVVLSHRIIRDERGRRLRIEVDESKRRLFDDLATLLLEGTPWGKVEQLLYQRYAHVNPKTGRRYGMRTMYKAVYNPYFWGHSGRHFDGKYGNWVFDPNEPPPPGVDVYYNTHQAVWTGELGERLKAELRRRGTLRGKATPESAYRFTGLLICADCRCTFGVYRHVRARRDGSHYLAWMCYTRWSNSTTRPECRQNRLIRDDQVEQYVNDMLAHLIALGSPDLLAVTDDRTDNAMKQIQGLRREIAETEAYIGELIIQQGKASTAIQHIYTQKIEEAASRLEILKHNLAVLQRDVESPSVAAARQQAYEDLVEMGLDGFWNQDARRINQMLHRIFGRRRLIVDQGKVAGLGMAARWR